MSLNAFFAYLGGKSALARYYPEPLHETVIEPFAGAAGYATRYHRRKVILVEKDPRVATIWRYLIRVSAAYNVNFSAGGGPRNSFTSWAAGSSSMWGPVLRARIAAQVERIRHWQLIEGDYTRAPAVLATWFIDPPYQVMGKHYRCSAAELDFPALGKWCRARRGQVIVCENQGADWLPFKPFHARAKSSNKEASAEVIWTKGCPA